MGEALAIRERMFGPAHPLVAASMATLADFHHESANVQEAYKAAQRALEVAAGAYRPTDAALGDFLNRVARSELAMGNYARAEQLYGSRWRRGRKAPACQSRRGGLGRRAGARRPSGE